MVSRTQIAVLDSILGAILLVQVAPHHAFTTSYVRAFFLLLIPHFVALFVWNAVLWPKVFSPIRHLPSPKNGSFINGQFWEIMKLPSGKPMQRWINEVPNDGLIRYTHILNKERVMLTSPKALGEVLVQKNYEFVKPKQVRENIGKILGVGILLAEGDQHKSQRKNLMPAFAYRHIKNLYPTFWSKSREMVHAITHEVNTLAASDTTTATVSSSGPVPAPALEISSLVSRAALDIIGLAGMGRDFGALANPNNELNTTYRKIFNATKQAKILGVLSLIIPVWLVRLIPVSRNDDIQAASETIRAVCRQLIQQKKIDMQEKGKQDIDILSVALQSGGFTDEDLVNQMMTFLAAGHETTATSMSWAVAELSRHPEMQNRLRAEIRAHLPSIDDEDAVISDKTFESLPYLNAVTSEVLRVHSPVSITRREAAKDTTILGQFVPKGTDIILCPYAVNMSTALWGSDALSFNPDRWLSPSSSDSPASSSTNLNDEKSGNVKANHNGGADSNYSFLTFLHGPRSCIGQAFAKAEFSCLLAAIVGRFEMELEEPDKELEIQGGITSRPKDLKVRLTSLEGW